MNQKINEKLKNLPKSPGVYIMRNATGDIIYVGKAKNLANRVSSYFAKTVDRAKTAALVTHIADLEWIITQTELEALILECNLIKKHRPKYNILLKDSGGFCYIRITSEPFPKLELTHSLPKNANSSQYFGPYLSAKKALTTIDLLKKIFKIRDCKRTITPTIIPPKTKKTSQARACLNHSINQCTAPCIGAISPEEYANSISQAKSFLKGDKKTVLTQLQAQMQQFSTTLEFEKAAQIRDKIHTIEGILEKQKITATTLDNKDVLGIAIGKQQVAIQIFFVRNGKILGRESFFVNRNEDESYISSFIKQYYENADIIPKSIIINEEIEDLPLLQEWLTSLAGTKISLIAPKRGLNAQLLKMANENAAEALQAQLNGRNIHQKRTHTLLTEIQTLLGLPQIPNRIEIYDISHISGANAVGGMVVFENATPKRSQYRTFNIKSSITNTAPNAQRNNDDYAAMQETIARRLAHDEWQTPNLILVDGGIGQVHAAQKALNQKNIHLPIFGLVKDEKHRTRGITNGENEINIPLNGKAFHFFTRMQDEVHRFALKTHEIKRTKTMLNSELTKIPGIGPKTQAALLQKFGSINAIKSASIEELTQVKGITQEIATAISLKLGPASK